MNIVKYFFFLILLLFSFFLGSQDLTSYVNPIIGTDKMGHTFPGATVPFGMVQLSPETKLPPMYIDGQYNKDVYAYCSGYQYADSTIFGFSHTHFSGTGHSDLGDFLIMPTKGELNLNPGDPAIPNNGWYSGFSHKNENAEPGYYSVLLMKYNILAELTATERVGFHQYTFPKSEKAHIILDLTSNIYNYEGKNVWTFIRVENDTLITGYRQTSGWARTKTLYFALTFSKPIESYGHEKLDRSPYIGFWKKFNEKENFPEMAGREIRTFFNFSTEENETIKLKFALSGVSCDGAIKNLNAEIPHWDFEQIKNNAKKKWNQELSKIEIETINQKDKVTFYTALYHTMLGPVLFEDVDGHYRGLDQNIHLSDGFKNYTIFSLWDTYRALHPLFNLIQIERNTDMINSMLAHYDQSVHHMLPIWSHYANENWCMIGYHAVPVIADAIIKGNKNIDLKRALDACVTTSNTEYYDGISYYKELGYVPEDKNSSSVSKTLEYAFDDWCIAQLAKKAKILELYDIYIDRSKNYRNLFNPSSGFMQPKLYNGSWKKNFNELDTHGQGFIEGNAWNYSLYVPHQVEEMISFMGGNDKFISHLDSLFTMKLPDEYFAKTEDITRDGIIGNYVHGNEPGHHIPYLYNFAGAPYKTQKQVRQIMNDMYGNGPDGLCGNDDAGQMSAWYIFSALGFYPVCPGSDKYEIGSPLIKSAIIHFENGNTLNIETINQSSHNFYIEKIILNGEELNRNHLFHKELISGGNLKFYLAPIPKEI